MGKKRLLNVILPIKKFKRKCKKKYRKLSEEEKEAKTKYGRNRYRNMTENEKSKLKKC